MSFTFDFKRRDKMAFNVDITRRYSSMQGRDKLKRARRSPSIDRPNMSDLRIILMGTKLSEIIRVRNSILRINVRESEDPLDYLQNHSVRISGTVENRDISFIISHHLLRPNLSDHEITQAVRECVSVSDPGPHVFMLVLQHHNFSEKDKDRVKHVLDRFSDQALKRTTVLTTDEETQTSKHLFRRQQRVNKCICQLIKECGGRHLHFDESQPTTCSEMFKLIDEILKEEPEEYLKCEMYVDAEGTPVDEPSKLEDSLRSEKKDSYHKDDGKPTESHKKERDGEHFQSSSSITGKSKLNLVLCGTDAGLKVCMSKLLRGKQLKTHQREPSSVCVQKEGKTHGYHISVVELPALTQLSEEKGKHQTLHCVCLCDPGVHVFLLIIPVGPLTDEDKVEMEKIQRIFYCSDRFMVIFVTDATVEGPVTDFVKFSTESQALISLCRGQYKVMGLKEHGKSSQIQDLLDDIKKMKTEPFSLQMYVRAQENRVRHETEKKYEEELNEIKSKNEELQLKINSYGASDEHDDLTCLRIVLIGKTGNGKSATGNTILGQNTFESLSSLDSVTTVCEKRVGKVDGRTVAIVDTPGLYDTTLSNEHAADEIVKCVSLSAPGPHVFIIVLCVGRFTKEESDTIDLIRMFFGPKVAQFSIVLFTNGDKLRNASIEHYVSSSNCSQLKTLLRDCGNRYLAFNNEKPQDRTQVTQLFNMIEEMKSTNQRRYFTNSMFEEAEMSIKKRIEEILKEKEREIQAQNEELKAKYEMEMENMMKRLEEEKRKAEEERINMETKFMEKEETLRKEFEEKEKAEQQKQEEEKQKRLEEDKKQRAEYDQKIEEMEREIEHQRSQHEKQQKEREEEDRKREEKYRQDQENMKNEQEHIIAELQKRQVKEIKKRDSEEQKRSEQEERERQEWARKIKEAESGRKEIQEEINRQQREWEEDKKQQMRERKEDERKTRERHEEQMREKQEELEKMRKKFEKEREEERQQRDEERQKQIHERQVKEREYEEKKNEMMKHYEQLERERKEEWERAKRADDERREEERKTWEKMIEDLKKGQLEEVRRRERQERERKEREEKEREEILKKHEQKIKEMKKKHEDEARKRAEELNEFRQRNKQHVQELNKMLEERQKQNDLLEKLYHHLKKQKGEEIKDLQKEVERLRKNSSCVIS